MRAWVEAWAVVLAGTATGGSAPHACRFVKKCTTVFRLWWHLSASDTLFCQHRWREVRTLKLRKERIIVAGTDRLVASWDTGRPT